MKRFAETKNDGVVEIPVVVGVGPIAVQPPIAIRVALNSPNVRVVIGVSLMRAISSITPPFEILILSGLNFMCDRNHSIQRTKYLHFFKISHTTLPEK